jgi:AcrR family transcriptional regulator
MDKHNAIVVGAADVFETEGFRGIGIDRIIASSGVSTRTLYKHFGSRDGLVIEVLRARHAAFMAQLAADPGASNPIAHLFDTLRHWIEARGARGCMLLRARSEYASACEEIVALVQQQKDEFRAEVAKRIRHCLGRDDATLTIQIWLMFEGATAGASVAGASVIDDAKQAALLLIATARGRAS